VGFEPAWFLSYAPTCRRTTLKVYQSQSIATTILAEMRSPIVTSRPIIKGEMAHTTSLLNYQRKIGLLRSRRLTAIADTFGDTCEDFSALPGALKTAATVI
jgi:hypothetical protein